MNADSIEIESDEDGFWLNLTLDGDIPADLWDALGESYGLRVRIHSCAEALHEQVNLIIGGWLAEAQSARHSVRVTREDLDAYELNDPKRASLEILLDGKDEVFV